MVPEQGPWAFLDLFYSYHICRSSVTEKKPEKIVKIYHRSDVTADLVVYLAWIRHQLTLRGQDPSSEDCPLSVAHPFCFVRCRVSFGEGNLA